VVYLINAEVVSYKTLDIKAEELSTITGDTVIIVLDEQTSSYLYDYYNTVRTLLINKNRVILVMIDSESKIRKQLCMLAVSYRNYDIYSVKSKDNINSEFIETVLDREPTIEEVETFIGADITAYSEINDILLKLCDRVSVEDIDKIKEIVYENKEMIQAFPSLLDYMKKTIDNYNTGLDSKMLELKTKIEEAEKSVSKARMEVDSKDQELKNALSEIEGLRKECNEAKQRCIDLEQQLNASGPSIRTYSTVNTSMIKCKVKCILYFKEISYVRYMNTFIEKFIEILEKIDKLNVKLVIYDNNSPFNCVYKPLPIITTSMYLSDKDTIVSKHSKIVVVEPNKVILEDILNNEYDCVIVYDRLKQVEDLVTGNCVFKYWVIGSLSQINRVESLIKIDRSKIITNVGVCKEAICLSEIDNFKSMTSSAKTSNYMQMRNLGNMEGRVIDIIKDKTNLRALINTIKK